MQKFTSFKVISCLNEKTGVWEPPQATDDGDKLDITQVKTIKVTNITDDIYLIKRTTTGASVVCKANVIKK